MSMTHTVKYNAKNGKVEWELRSNDKRMITPDRFISKGFAKTQRLAEIEANIAWVSFCDSFKG